MDNNTKDFPKDTFTIGRNTYASHSIEDANANHWHIKNDNCAECNMETPEFIKGSSVTTIDSGIHLIGAVGQPDLRHSPLSPDHIQIKATPDNPITKQIDWHSECIVCGMPCQLLITIKYHDFWSEAASIRKEIRKYGWELLGEVVDGKVNKISAHISCRAMEKIAEIQRNSVVIEGRNEGDNKVVSNE